MGNKKNNNKEGDDMIVRKKIVERPEIKITTASNSDILKAIDHINNKHSKAMEKLSK